MKMYIWPATSPWLSLKVLQKILVDNYTITAQEIQQILAAKTNNEESIAADEEKFVYPESGKNVRE